MKYFGKYCLYKNFFFIYIYRKTLRNRKSLNSSLDPVDRRKSRRHSAGNSCVQMPLLMERLDISPSIQRPNILLYPGMRYYVVINDLIFVPYLTNISHVFVFYYMY